MDTATRGGIRALSRQELQELGVLYRQIAADLATVREDPSSARFATSLNRLLARAHHTIYSSDRPAASRLAQLFLQTFPGTFRALRSQVLASLALLLVGGAVGVVLTLRDPDFTSRILGPEMVDTINRHEMWTHSIVAMKPAASSLIMTNNIGVTFAAFSGGIVGGLGTVYIMAFNGLLLGVVGAACAVAGMSVPLWSFVAPHGALELPAIVLSGAAGLRLGQGVLFPGFLPRRASVARAGAEAVTLVIGCVPILVVAGVIEAFVSPTALAVPLKFGMGAALFVLLAWYLIGFGRPDTRPGSAA